MRLFSALIKIHQILVTFETANQFLFKFCITPQCHETKLLCTFSAEIVYIFNKRRLSKYKFGENSRDQSKVWNFALWWAPFVQIIQSLSQKCTEELSLMTLKSDVKFKEKLTCGFKYYMRNLVNFHPTNQKSENFTLTSYFCLRYIKFELKE